MKIKTPIYQSVPKAKPGLFMVDRMGLQSGNRRYYVVKSLESATRMLRKFATDNPTLWRSTPMSSGWDRVDGLAGRQHAETHAESS